MEAGFTVESKNKEGSLFLNIDREPVPEKEFYWHATFTGANGEITEGIKQNGLLPKDVLPNDLTVGNQGTIKTAEAYVSDHGAAAANYLKHAVGYNEEAHGLPMFVCVKVRRKDSGYSFDDDLFRGNSEDQDLISSRAWYAYLLTYETVNEFLAENFSRVSFSAVRLQDLLSKLKGKTIDEVKSEIWSIVHDEGFKNFTFFEGLRLKKLLKVVNPDRWHRFLTYFNRLGSHKLSMVKNLSRKGGWLPEEIKRVYVMSPSGDPDWKKWALSMPPEIATRWEEWDRLSDINGNPLPGKGRLVRIK